MITAEDVEGFLDRLDGGTLQSRAAGEGLWLVHTRDGLEVAVNAVAPLLVLRINVMRLPKDAKKLAGLCRKLLEFNAKDLTHGAYGIEGNDVVLTDTLSLDRTDFQEFEASFDTMTLALAQHFGALAPYRET
ncbi:MAG: YbjN domain-containing protein [Gemmatimonadales bacterium]